MYMYTPHVLYNKPVFLSLHGSLISDIEICRYVVYMYNKPFFLLRSLDFTSGSEYSSGSDINGSNVKINAENLSSCYKIY